MTAFLGGGAFVERHVMDLVSPTKKEGPSFRKEGVPTGEIIAAACFERKAKASGRPQKRGTT
jgi:hypothetical protein